MSDSEDQTRKEPGVPQEDDLTFDEEFRRAADQEEEGEQEDGGELQSQNQAKRPRQEDADDDEDDEEDDDDDDEDDEDDEDEVSNKRKRRRGANQFFDIEAEVDDEDEDDDEDDEEAEILREEFITDDHAPLETVERVPQDDRLHRQYDNRRQQVEDEDAEKLAEELKQRYRKSHTAYRGETAASGTVSQKLLMPSINDPSIYAIRVTPGKEKELVRKLYKKKRTLERQGTPLDILTVFQRDAFTGYIYIEAKRPDAIDRALQGMVNVFMRDKLLVPVKEYPDLLKQVKTTDVEVVPGIYVRIKRGVYKGDLAVVDNLSENGLDVRCKVVPRLDYGVNDTFDKNGRRQRPKMRAQQGLFSEHKARTHDPEKLQNGTGRGHFRYRGNDYVDGFLYKDFRIQFLQTQDVHPSLEELDKLQIKTDEDGLNLAAIAATLKNNKSDGLSSTAFQPGDKVEIRRGEQAKTIGIVTEAALNEVTIKVTDSGDPKFVNQSLTVPSSDLRKIFNEGDHVRAIEGRHFDETGLVIKIDGDSVIFVSDQTREDVKVFANYLVKATDASSNVDQMKSKYDIKDLVELSSLTVGVIVKAEKNIFAILTTDGRLIDVKPSGIASKILQSRREQVSTDKQGMTIRVGDTVKELLGDKSREGTIVHIYKNSLFIKSTDVIENLGIFVANRMNVTTVSTKDAMVSKSLGPDLTSMNPNLRLPNANALAGLKTRIGGRDKLIYKDVQVTSGSYKGLKGKVTEADDEFARIELHTKSKKIKVRKQHLNVMVHGEPVPYMRFIGAAPDERFGGPAAMPPTYNSGGRSSWGGATPSVAAGGGASSWGGRRTGAPAGGASTWGGKTPAYGGAGGKTPAYGAAAGGASTWGGAGGASTWGGSGGASTWGGGNKGSASAWGGNRGGASAWGGAKGNGSAWGGNNKGNTSAWGGANQDKGNPSKWGGNGAESAWGGNGGASAWGGAGGNNSTWGGKKGNSSAWGGNN
ncbi:Transcription elongation factor SPT5 [Candida viswanathii]|uniref:Transcription elongation factor SPT5 n=1 Tax=Candida viswanathii TaxID=5486 RepID=A0A367XRI9_9ASCO|nr:Transcription elongation factor SPT5 [Candida viswanathii]